MDTPISEKKKIREGKKSNKSQDNWSRFAYLSLFAFIIVLFIGLLGANFIFITGLKSEATDILFPSKESNYFNENVLRGGSGIDSKLSPDYACNIKGNFGNLSNLMSILPSKEFPYSLKQKSSLTESFLNKIKNWFAMTCAESFMTSREVLKWWLSQFSKKSILGNDTFQMLFVAPLNLGVGTTIAFMIGLITSIMALFNTSGPLGFIFGFIFVYNFIFMSTLSVIQSMLFFCTFLFLPLFLDFKKVLYILNCNISTLSTLFGVLTCITALLSFDVTSASIYIVSFVLISIISFFISAVA